MRINNFVKRMIPTKLKQIVKRYLFFKKYGFAPPPSFSDINGYELLLDLIIQQKIYQFSLYLSLYNRVFQKNGV